MHFRVPCALLLALMPAVRLSAQQPESPADARLRALYTAEWTWRQREFALGERGAGSDGFPRVDGAAQQERLTYEMWRACRLVIDTGIHQFGWALRSTSGNSTTLRFGHRERHECSRVDDSVADRIERETGRHDDRPIVIGPDDGRALLEPERPSVSLIHQLFSDVCVSAQD